MPTEPVYRLHFRQVVTEHRTRQDRQTESNACAGRVMLQAKDISDFTSTLHFDFSFVHYFLSNLLHCRKECVLFALAHIWSSEKGRGRHAR